MIRDAEADDLPALVEMAERFTVEAGFDADFDPGSAAATMAKIIHSDAGILLVSDTGMIGGAVFPMDFNRDVLLAHEAFWYGDWALLDVFESRARALGATKIVMNSLEGKRSHAMARLYRRQGYRPLEHTFIKEF